MLFLVLGLISGAISTAGLYVPSGPQWIPGLVYGLIVICPALKQRNVPWLLFLPAIGVSVLAYYLAYLIQAKAASQPMLIYALVTTISGFVGSGILAVGLMLMLRSTINVKLLIACGTIFGFCFGLLIVLIDSGDFWWTAKMFLGFAMWQTATAYALKGVTH